MNVRIDGKWYYVETAEQLLELLEEAAKETPVYFPVIWEAEILLGYTPVRVVPGVGGYLSGIAIPPGVKFHLEITVAADLQITYCNEGQQTFVEIIWGGVKIPQILGKLGKAE